MNLWVLFFLFFWVAHDADDWICCVHMWIEKNSLKFQLFFRVLQFFYCYYFYFHFLFYFIFLFYIILFSFSFSFYIILFYLIDGRVERLNVWKKIDPFLAFFSLSNELNQLPLCLFMRICGRLINEMDGMERNCSLCVDLEWNFLFYFQLFFFLWIISNVMFKCFCLKTLNCYICSQFSCFLLRASSSIEMNFSYWNELWNELLFLLIVFEILFFYFVPHIRFIDRNTTVVAEMFLVIFFRWKDVQRWNLIFYR